MGVVDPPGETQRVKMPCQVGEVLGESFAGRVGFSRRFGEPTAIEPHEAVWLVIDSPHRISAVSLNEIGLFESEGERSRLELEITERLIVRNLLSVELEIVDVEQGDDRELLGEVWLEIRS